MLDFTDHIIRKAYCLSLNEYAVLLEIYYLSHNNKFGGWCIKSKANIAETLDLSRDVVTRAIKKLIEKELIEKNEASALRTTDNWNSVIAERNNYAISIKTETEDISSVGSAHTASKSGTHCLKISQEVPQNQARTALNSGTNIYNKDIHINKHKIYICAKFEKFWESYPKKKSKEAAIKAWNKLSEKEKDHALLEIEKHKQQESWIKDNGQYIPYPATWLNGKRFNDEFEPVTIKDKWAGQKPGFFN